MENVDFTEAFNRSDHFLSLGRRAEELGNSELAKMYFARSEHWWSRFVVLTKNIKGDKNERFPHQRH